jgi:hypothetical protein
MRMRNMASPRPDPRRSWIRAALLSAFLACALFLPPTAHAIGPSSEFSFALLDLDGLGVSSTWLRAFRDAAERVGEITSVPVHRSARVIPLASLKSSAPPLIVLALDRLPAIDATAAAEPLRPFLRAGGTLWVLNSAVWNAREAVDGWTRRLVRATGVGSGLAVIPAEGVLYRSFFYLPSGQASLLEGSRSDGRYAVIYSPFWVGQARMGRERFRLAVNVLEYALCGDYKDEQTHIDYLLKRRRWKVPQGAD